MSGLMQTLMPHVMTVPILLPLITACVLMLVRERAYRSKTIVALISTLLNLVVVVLLLEWIWQGGETQAFGIYLPSNWEVPYGIVLVLDHLSALMLVVAAVVALMALLFAVARWHKAGVHFHSLFQLQIMGLNGAFLTGDLFNLFVFFEVMLAASYGLALHGSGPTRVKAGLHYIAINLLASSLFLVGAAMIYGLTGTLNMADLAARLPEVADADRGLLHAGFAILAVAFLAKAAMWPLNFWLVPAYSSASAPSAAIFALLTKVGVYVLLRLSTLLFAADGAAGFGQSWLLWGGMATILFGTLGLLVSQQPGRLAGFAVIVSSGTLLAMIGLARPEVTAGALYYLPASTFAIAAFFLLAELMDRSRDPESAGHRAPEDEQDNLPYALADQDMSESVNLDDDEAPLVGRVIPASMALLGLAFICCTVLLAGLPPLAGFIGKFAMLSALLVTPDSAVPVAAVSWLLLAVVIASGLFAIIAFSRVGIRFFWVPANRSPPILRLIEYVPIVTLLGACVALTIWAEAMMDYAGHTAALLYEPDTYIDAVLSAQPQLTDTNAERLGAGNVEGLP